MKDYKQLAKETRREVLSLIHKGQTSHIASCLSCTDIATVLYENLGKNDRVIFSKGWASALYYVLNIRQGILNRDEVFNTFPDYPYPALLEPPTTGVDIPTGSVGHGLNFAVGVALGKKRAKEKGKVYVIISDGELNEGSTWEGIIFAAHHKLDNLIVIEDKNGWQAMGKTEDVIDIDEQAMFNAAKWNTSVIDGHNYEQIEWDINEANYDAPKIIIAKTTKGKGVSFMENHLQYHYAHITDEDYNKAISEL